MTDESAKDRAGAGLNDRIGQTDKPAMGTLIPQPHGGAIRYGNTPGGTPGSGRPKNELRARMRKHLDEEVLAQTLADYRAGKFTSLAVAEFLARYGIGTQTETVSADEMRDQATRMLDVLVDDLTAKGWSLADVQALATKMAVAASNDEPEG